MYFQWFFTSAREQYDPYFQVGSTYTEQRTRHNNKNNEELSLISSGKACAVAERRIRKCNKATDVILPLSKYTLEYGFITAAIQTLAFTVFQKWIRESFSAVLHVDTSAYDVLTERGELDVA